MDVESMIAQLQSAVLRRISATGAKRALEEIPEVVEAYPHLRTWKPNDLGYHWGTLVETDMRIRGEAYEDIETTDLVILDDLGRTPLSGREMSLVSGLIDTRYSHNLPVIVTTNLSRADLSERVGVQIVSRLWGSCMRITMTGPDRRMAPKYQQMNMVDLIA